MGKSHQRADFDPYRATLFRARPDCDEYLVESATTEDAYVTGIHHASPGLDRCSCPARVPCRHMQEARLRQHIERVEANTLALYRDWALPRLAVEDARLRLLLAEVDSWLVRAQLGVVGNVIGERLDGEMAEAG
jgi:hypothetical protein